MHTVLPLRVDRLNTPIGEMLIVPDDEGSLAAGSRATFALVIFTSVGAECSVIFRELTSAFDR
jgi:hypothetical protein